MAVVAFGMATGILTARTLHPQGRGELTAMILWPLFLANATALGTPSSLIFHLRKHPERRGELITTALTLVLTLGMLAALVGVFVLPHWLSHYPPQVIDFARLFLITAPLWAVQITGQSALEAMDLFSWSNLVQIMIPMITLSGLLTVWATHRMQPIAAAACYAIAIVPTSFTILGMLWSRRSPRHAAPLRFHPAAARLLLGYGVRSAPLDLLGTLNVYIDQVLVIGLLNASAMGAYAVVLSLSRALLVFQSAVVMVLFPRAAGRSLEEILPMVGKAVRVSLLVTGAASVSAALLGPVLVRLLYGHAYLIAVPALYLLLTEVVLQGAVVIVSQAFMAAGRPGVVSILQGTGLALAVPLMFLFIPRLGVQGAALALLCSTLTRLLLLLLAVPAALHRKLPRLIPGAADVAILWDAITKRG
jgi:O-antigen/teichoic acid export membrane protein